MAGASDERPRGAVTPGTETQAVDAARQPTLRPDPPPAPAPPAARSRASEETLPVVLGEQVTLFPEEAEGRARRFAVTPESPGRYRRQLDPEIGRGGIGRVLRAHDQHLGRDVAVKELLADARRLEPGLLPSDADGGTPVSPTVLRFLREARVTGHLEHPNIVPVYELGERADGTLYYTMKLVRGRTLAAALREADGLAGRLALLAHYGHLCNAIAYAHSRGVIHRDLKADNVMLGEFGETLVLDWGLAKVKGRRDLRGAEIAREAQLYRDAAAGLTVEGALLGTPSTMSPEQAAGAIDAIDERSDVWSLGAVLYELLAGRRPFRGATAWETISKVQSEAVTPPRQLDEEIPAELSSICMKALSRDRDARYPSARELAAEIASFQSGARVLAHEYTSLEHLRRFAAKNKPALIAGGAILLAIVTSLVLVASSWRDEREARRWAQHAAVAARRAEGQAQREHRRASHAVAQGLFDRGLKLAREGALLEARVYAAGSLAEAEAADDPERAPERAALRLAARSLAFQTGAAGPLRLERSLRLGSPLSGVALSRDGLRLAAVGASPELALVELKGGALRVLRGPREGAWAVAFSPDGGRLAVAGRDGAIQLLSSSGESVGTLPGHAGGSYALAFTPDGGRLVSAGHDGKVAVWELAGRRLARALDGHSAPVHALALDARGERLASGGRDRTVRIWELASGRCLRVLAGHEAVVRGVALSPDGARVASASYDKSVRVWDAATGTPRFTHRAFSDEVLAAAFTPDGRGLAVASWDQSLRLLDASSGALLLRVQAHEGAVWGLSFSSDGALLASVGEDRRARLWRVRAAPPALGAEGQGYLWSLRVSPDGTRLAAAGSDGVVRVQPLAGGAPLLLRGHRDLVAEVAFSPDGTRLASAGYDREVRVFELSSGRVLHTLVGHQGFVRSVAFSPDGARLASASVDKTIRIWDAARGAPLRTIDAGTALRRVRYAPGGTRLAAAGGDGAIHLLAEGGPRLGRIPVAKDMVVDLAFSRDGRRLLATSGDGVLALCELEPGRVTWRARHGPTLYGVRFAQEERLAIAGSDDRKVLVYRIGEPAPLLALEAEQSVTAIELTRDGGSLIVGDDRTARFYPLAGLARSLAVAPAALLDEAQRDAGLALAAFRLRVLDGASSGVRR
jgi:WD40 repeat protein/serine/threonine protein kinase